MRPLLICVIVLFCTNSYSQNFEEYQLNVQKARQAIEYGNYEEAANFFSTAFYSCGGMAMEFDAYDAAVCYAMSNRKDSAFKYLLFITEPGLESYKNFEKLSTDEGFEMLYNEPKWDSIKNLVIDNYKMAHAYKDENLVVKLSEVYVNDQEDRQTLRDYKNDTVKTSELRATIKYKDSINQTIVADILDEKGWLGPDIVGYEGSKALFLVVQHADLEMQLKYVPLLRKAVKERRAYGKNLALLEDRIAIKQGRKQLYGSQVVFDELTQHYFIEPTIDPEMLDERRIEIGLVTIAEYLSYWGEDWDLEKHKEYWKRNQP